MPANAILWLDNNGVAFRAGRTDDVDPPLTFDSTFEFEIGTNLTLWNDINNTFDVAVWSYTNNFLRKDGVAQSVNPVSSTSLAIIGVENALADLLTLSTMNFANNTQRDNAIRRLAEIERAILRVVKQLAKKA